MEASPKRTPAASPAPELPSESPKTPAPAFNRIPSTIVAVVIAAVAGLSIYYLVRGEPLLVQGEVEATRFDIAARVDGRVGEVSVARGQNVAANAVLVLIDNPETLAKHEQALAASRGSWSLSRAADPKPCGACRMVRTMLPTRP